jgi:hypothetical protein
MSEAALETDFETDRWSNTQTICLGECSSLAKQLRSSTSADQGDDCSFEAIESGGLGKTKNVESKLAARRGFAVCVLEGILSRLMAGTAFIKNKVHNINERKNSTEEIR